MERLAYDVCIGEKHCWQIKGAGNFTCKEVCEKQDGCEECPIAAAFDRLAAYEDTMPLERAQDLAQAEKDGLLMVLPCKVGDTVYFPIMSRWDSAVIESIEFCPDKIWIHWEQRDVGPEIDEFWDDGCFDMEDIGKTVFLTREEAEAALKKMEEAGNEAD